MSRQSEAINTQDGAATSKIMTLKITLNKLRRGRYTHRHPKGLGRDANGIGWCCPLLVRVKVWPFLQVFSAQTSAVDPTLPHLH